MGCRVTDDEEDIVALEVPESWGLMGKVAVVTGGGAAGDGIGNGRAAAILLARAGAQVVVVDRDAALAQRTVTMITEAGGSAMAVPADVTRAADCAGSCRPRSIASAGSTCSITTSASAAVAPCSTRLRSTGAM